MKLIIGLGNPGKKYEGTRHNVGQALASLAKLKIKDEKLKIVNDLGIYMNQSGEIVKKLVGHYKIPLDDLLIIHDDLDIPLGDFRLQKGRGAAGHKGVESIVNALGGNGFWRLRIGIGRPQINEKCKMKNEKLTEEYVLEEFINEELKSIKSLISKIVNTIKDWVISNGN